ncbi:hypothetical protein PISMIDRAFT_11400 [Pisolithus microcarpus 441]|uniref:Uncharacterized protein n=1 Tax=Pisolithus microcarpus 441 TaxID=765257 RepID=A0A0C9Z0T8_9AGAM|nr:hypothetical protein PISMIDRAFT_11400 [Pisolithus microcarpus 441]
MASAKHRCKCEVYGCMNGSDPDPCTQLPTPGRLLPLSMAYQHRRDDKIWCAARQYEHMELNLLVATAGPETHSEDVTSSKAYQSELGNESTFVPNVLLKVPGKESNSVTSIQLLQQYRDMFQSTVSSFTPPHLRFMSDHPAAADITPPIDPNDQRGSRLFIIHQQYVGKLLELVSAVCSDEDDDVVLTRKQLILDIQAHQGYLERIRNYQWQRQEVEIAAKDAPRVGSCVPMVVKTGRWSELLRLPYWDPTRFVVVEAMHNFFLGDLQHHCRKVFGMNADVKSAAGTRIQPHTPEEQQRELDASIEAIKKRSLSALRKLRKGYIIALAEANNVLLEINLSNDPLHRLHGDPEIRCPHVFPRPVVDLSTAWSNALSITILDQSVLSAVWKDMERTILPSSVARAPHNLGSAGHGKLIADQWWTACSINLTITLCRLWGSDSASERDVALLRNYLSLVTAVCWATTHSTSDQHAEIVEKHLIYYIRSTLQIFGPRALVYNNHASLHVPECLRAFGPTHGWWAFPFERYNGVLQSFKTNTRIGEMEHTMMRAFCWGSNLRALLGKSSSDPFQGIRETFSQFFSVAIPSLDVTHGSDDPNITENAERLLMLPDKTYECLLYCLNEGVTSGHRYVSYREDPQPNTQVVQPYVQEKVSVKIQGATFVNHFSVQGKFNVSSYTKGMEHQASLSLNSSMLYDNSKNSHLN